jgi:sec-independent protein translocase protein TatA
MAPTAAIAFLSVGPSGGEMLVVFVVTLLLFGPRRLPEIARGIGKALELLRKSSQDFKDQIMNIEQDPPRRVPSAAGQPEQIPAGDADSGDAPGPDSEPSAADGARPGKDSADDYAG